MNQVQTLYHNSKCSVIYLNIFFLLVLENLLELNEHQLSTKNDIHSLYNVSIPTQVI
jgi:hypothetical protein